MINNWFDDAVMKPYMRQKPLCVYGPNAHNRECIINFLIGYFKPMTHIDVTYVDVMDGYNAWLLDRQLIIVGNYSLRHMALPRHLTHERLIRVASRLYEGVKIILNVTKWIINSEILLPDCMTVDVKQLSPFPHTLASACELGIWTRQRERRINKTMLRTILKEKP